MMSVFTFTATLTQGHRVASGLANDSRFPRGTLKLQQPFFKLHGLDVSGYYLGTLNLDTSPYIVQLHHPKYTFHNIKWHSQMPSESFSFTPCSLLIVEQGRRANISENISRRYLSLIYQPHIETKTEHRQPLTIIEILSPYIQDVGYGDKFLISIDTKYLAN